MDDFRLRVFVSAAKNLNFSRCADEMHISQPAVSKHISEIESRYGVSLFSRGTSGVALTKAGKILLRHAESLLQSFRDMDYEMSMLGNVRKGNLKIGASTTIAQYLLPSVLARFLESFDGVEISMASGNSENVEQWLLNGDIDMGFVENTSRKPSLHYEHLLSDELVLVCGTSGRFGKTESLTAGQLTGLPVVLRETGSGTREIIARRLASRGVRIQDMNVVIELSSTEAIKAFVKNSDTLAIVSVIAVAKEISEGSLKIIDIDDLSMEREFATVVRPGEFMGLRERFHLFARHQLMR